MNAIWRCLCGEGFLRNSIHAESYQERTLKIIDSSVAIFGQDEKKFTDAWFNSSPLSPPADDSKV
jgi:hypothetical protein